jgi:hypothetical protein
MRRAGAVLLGSAIALGVASTGTASAKPHVVTTTWKASYTLAAEYSNTWNEPPEQYCPGVQWKESAAVTEAAAFPRLKLKLQSGALGVADGAVFPAGANAYSASGNWFPDLQCSEAPRQASCGDRIDYRQGRPPLNLAAQVRGGKVYFTTGAADGLTEVNGNDCVKPDQTAGPHLGFGAAIAPWKSVIGKVSLADLARKKRIHLFLRTNRVAGDYDPIACDGTPGCSAKFQVTKSDLTLTLVKRR